MGGRGSVDGFPLVLFHFIGFLMPGYCMNTNLISASSPFKYHW